VAGALHACQLHKNADVPLEASHVLVVVLAADVDDLGEQLVAVVRTFGFVHVQHEFLDDLHEVLLGDHAVEEIERAQADGLVFVVQTLHNEVLVGLDALGVGQQDLGHG